MRDSKLIILRSGLVLLQTGTSRRVWSRLLRSVERFGVMLLIWLGGTTLAVADTPGQQAARDFVAKFNDVILFPLIYLLTAIASVVFLWGGFKFVSNADNEKERETGKQVMLWGIIGFVVMTAAFALLSIVAGTFGLQNELQDTSGFTL